MLAGMITLSSAADQHVTASRLLGRHKQVHADVTETPKKLCVCQALFGPQDLQVFRE